MFALPVSTTPTLRSPDPPTLRLVSEPGFRILLTQRYPFMQLPGS